MTTKKVENEICFDCQYFRNEEDWNSSGMIWYNHFCRAPEAEELEKDARNRTCVHIRQTGSACDYCVPLEQTRWRKVFIVWPRKIGGQWHFLETVEGRQLNDLALVRTVLGSGEKCVLKPRWEYRQVTTMDDENCPSLG